MTATEVVKVVEQTELLLSRYTHWYVDKGHWESKDSLDCMEGLRTMKNYLQEKFCLVEICRVRIAIINAMNDFKAIENYRHCHCNDHNLFQWLNEYEY